MGVTRELAQYTVTATWSDFPPETVETTKGLLLKTIAGMVVGSREPAGRKLTNYLTALGGTPEAGIVGGGFRTTAENAAWAHGTFAHASELEDDTFFRTCVGDYWVFPAIFSLGEKLVSSGRDVIEAATVSFEIASRLSDAAPGFLEMGIAPSTWFGPIATAAAAAKLLRLPTDQVHNALSIASSHSSGFAGQLGWDAHFIETGGIQRAGVLSAYLAKEGCTGCPDILEVKDGTYAPVWEAGGVNLPSVTTELGKAPFAVHRVWVKKFPCCFALHTAIDALMMIMREHELRNEDVELVEVEADPFVLEYTDRVPDTLAAARFSQQHALSEVLLRGKVDLDSFIQTERLNDPDSVETRAKVRMILRDDWPAASLQAQVTVVTKDGQKFSKYLRTAIGGTDHPLTLSQVVDVSRPYLDAFLPDTVSHRVEEILLNLEKQPDVRELMNLLTFFRNGDL